MKQEKNKRYFLIARVLVGAEDVPDVDILGDVGIDSNILGKCKSRKRRA